MKETRVEKCLWRRENKEWDTGNERVPLIGSTFVFPEKWKGGLCCLGAQTVLNLCFGTRILSTFVATYPNMTTPIVIEKWLKRLPLHSTTKQNCYFHNKSYYSALSIAIALIFKYSKSHQDFKKCNSLWDFLNTDIHTVLLFLLMFGMMQCATKHLHIYQ